MTSQLMRQQQILSASSANVMIQTPQMKLFSVTLVVLVSIPISYNSFPVAGMIPPPVDTHQGVVMHTLGFIRAETCLDMLALVMNNY